MLFTGSALWRFDISPARLISGLGGAGVILAAMFPPASGDSVGDLWFSLLETIAMAFLGTVIATVLAVPLGILAARNLVPSWAVHFFLRRGLDTLRGIDQLIWGLVFVRAVGLGPIAGIMALAMSDTGTLAKLFSEAIEAIDRRGIDSVRSVGATRLQIFRYAVLPQLIPTIVSQTLFFFESNIRTAAILGAVGAGGIGLELTERIRVQAWDQAAYVIIMIFFTTMALDTISRALRRRLIGP